MDKDYYARYIQSYRAFLRRMRKTGHMADIQKQAPSYYGKKKLVVGSEAEKVYLTGRN